jgi:hypothetical protein
MGTSLCTTTHSEEVATYSHILTYLHLLRLTLQLILINRCLVVG